MTHKPTYTLDDARLYYPPGWKRPPRADGHDLDPRADFEGIAFTCRCGERLETGVEWGQREEDTVDCHECGMHYTVSNQPRGFDWTIRNGEGEEIADGTY